MKRKADDPDRYAFGFLYVRTDAKMNEARLQYCNIAKQKIELLFVDINILMIGGFISDTLKFNNLQIITALCLNGILIKMHMIRDKFRD